MKTEDLAPQFWTKFIPYLGQTGYPKESNGLYSMKLIQGF